MSRDIPYFKIKYSIKSTWGMEEAAYLLVGANPDATDLKIGPKESNKVSRLYMWLKRMQSENQLHRVAFGQSKLVENAERNVGRKLTRLELLKLVKQGGDISSRKRYDPTQIIALMAKHKKLPDSDVAQIIELLSKNTKTGKIQNQINRSIYRHAAKILWEKYPTLYADDLAQWLHELPKHLNGTLPITVLAASSIREYLKGLSPHKKGAPKKQGDIAIAIDWGYVLEKM